MYNLVGLKLVGLKVGRIKDGTSQIFGDMRKRRDENSGQRISTPRVQLLQGF